MDFVLNNLPTSNYSLEDGRDQSSAPEGWIYGQSNMFEEVTFMTRQLDLPDGVIGEIEIDANLDFVPTS